MANDARRDAVNACGLSRFYSSQTGGRIDWVDPTKAFIFEFVETKSDSKICVALNSRP